MKEKISYSSMRVNFNGVIDKLSIFNYPFPCQFFYCKFVFSSPRCRFFFLSDIANERFKWKTTLFVAGPAISIQNRWIKFDSYFIILPEKTYERSPTANENRERAAHSTSVVAYIVTCFRWFSVNRWEKAYIKRH